MGPGMFAGVDTFIKVGLWVMAISLPLGVWKAIELLWWVWSHLHWGSL